MLDLFINDEDLNFAVLYFNEPDEIGHVHGPYSSEIKECLEEFDNLIGYMAKNMIRLGLFDELNIILTSDHGMGTVSEEKFIDLSDFVDINKFDS